MTEQLVIEGVGLTVTHLNHVTDGQEHVTDPKRRRPPAIPAARHDGTARTTGRTLDQVLAQPNPYWTQEENHAAEQHRNAA